MNGIDNFFSGIGGFLAGIGALLAGLAALAGLWRKSGRPTEEPDQPRRAAKERLRWLFERWTAVATVAALAVAGAGVVILVSRTPPPCRPVRVTITSPTTGELVNLTQVATGKVSCLNPDQHIWLVVQVGGHGGGGYFPQTPVSVASNAKSWSTTVHFGQPSAADNRRPFTLLAVVADNSTNQIYRKYLAAGATHGSYPALADLNSATVLSQVKVIRGSF